jgi:Ca2+-transporting ATPase
MIRVSPTPHAQASQSLLDAYQSRAGGLSAAEATARLLQFGPNRLPTVPGKPFLLVFVRQFLNPLIYVLLIAVVLSLLVAEWLDAGFILLVLSLNALIGSLQEFSAQRSAAALHTLLTFSARVVRDRQGQLVNTDRLVPGDIVLLESGDKVPADLRLLEAQNFSVDESLLTGESLPRSKNPRDLPAADCALPERSNMAFTGTLVVSGRATGLVTTTGSATELGRIARDVLGGENVKPPLLVRMERFTWRLTQVMGFATVILALVSLYQGMHWFDVVMLATALAVAAIPEGLPVAMTVALSISVRRMATRHVIARQLVTVEALGSCTLIASDKTGTLTRNEIVVQRLALPGQADVELPTPQPGPGARPDPLPEDIDPGTRARLLRLALVMSLTNEAVIGERDGQWQHHGDSIDVALLIMAQQLGISRAVALEEYPQCATVPYESSARYSASLHRAGGQHLVCVKGALETVLPMCSTMTSATGEQAIDRVALLQQGHALAAQGYRVLAAAQGDIRDRQPDALENDDLQQLTFLGMTAMIDPLRDESVAAIEQCRSAGIDVVMVTGDHPLTAFAMGRALNLVQRPEQVVTSQEFNAAMSDAVRSRQMLQTARVYARMEPHQKLELVNALKQQGHFVAVTGDGANDAPALRAAHVGVAMGGRGTDVARETADLILTDDNFSSIVAGMEEGRVAYANVRKVIFLLISTGFAELVLFFLSLLLGLPMPLTAVQLLWLNLVTNGIQDVALAFEPAEGGEMNRPPRPTGEPVFNRIMVERVALSAVLISVITTACYAALLRQGMEIESARNLILLLMVLFENIQVFNARSETRSVFTHTVLRNPFLLIATLGAQALHIIAMYTPGLRDVLEIAPVSLTSWFLFLSLAASLLVAAELYKRFRRW